MVVYQHSHMERRIPSGSNCIFLIFIVPVPSTVRHLVCMWLNPEWMTVNVSILIGRPSQYTDIVRSFKASWISPAGFTFLYRAPAMFLGVLGSLFGSAEGNPNYTQENAFPKGEGMEIRKTRSSPSVQIKKWELSHNCGCQQTLLLYKKQWRNCSSTSHSW